MPLYTLVYVSRASRKMTEKDLIDILESSRENNAELDITGLLLYNGDSFMQVLEGEKDMVLGLYRKINADMRHRLSRVIYQREITTRSFGDWQMGFHNLTQMNSDELEGYTDFLTRPLTDDEYVQNPGRVHLFLQLFRQQGPL